MSKVYEYMCVGFVLSKLHMYILKATAANEPTLSIVKSSIVRYAGVPVTNKLSKVVHHYIYNNVYIRIRTSVGFSLTSKDAQHTSVSLFLYIGISCFCAKVFTIGNASEMACSFAAAAKSELPSMAVSIAWLN